MTQATNGLDREREAELGERIDRLTDQVREMTTRIKGLKGFIAQLEAKDASAR